MAVRLFGPVNPVGNVAQAALALIDAHTMTERMLR